MSKARQNVDKLNAIISVLDYGAVGDGVTDDRAAIAAAAASARGKTLMFPAGQYRINTDGGSITLEEVTILGETVQDGASTIIDQGASFAIYGTTNSPFKLRRGVTFDGVGFYYPTQTDSATPTVFPVTLVFDFANGAVQFVWIKNCVSFNAYRFLDINDTGGNVGHVWIEDNTICALNRGIYIRHNLEHIRIAGNNFTFGHWLPATEAGSRAYVRANCIYVQVDQSDGVEIIDNLFFGSLTAISVANTALCQFMTLSLNKLDQIRFPIRAGGTGNLSGLIALNTFNSFNSQSTASQARSIEITTTGSDRETLVISSNNFQVSTEEHIYVSNNTPTRDINIIGNNFLSWAAFKSSGTYGALNLNGNNTSASITGNRFTGVNNAARSNGVIGSFNTLEMNACRFDSCLTPLNVTLSTVVGAGNSSFLTGGSNSDVISATLSQWGPNAFDKPNAKTSLQFIMSLLSNNTTYADDAAAAAGGIPVGGVYRNGSVLQVRVT